MHPCETTERMTTAYRKLANLDLDALFGSGLVVTIEALDERGRVPPVAVAAEHFEPVKRALIEAMQFTLNDRRAMLKGQLRSIDVLLVHAGNHPAPQGGKPE